MGAVKTAVGRKGIANRSTRAPGIRLLAFAGLVFGLLFLIAVIGWLIRGPFFHKDISDSSSKQEMINASGQDAQDIARLKRQAMRQATNRGEQGKDEREYYRSALRMLRRMNDIHTRL